MKGSPQHNLPEFVIEEFQKGDDKAFARIYDELYPTLRYFAEQLIHDSQEARDIVVETFIKLFNMRDRFDSFVNIRAFLYITVRNACFDYLRYKKRVEDSKKELVHLSEQDEIPPEFDLEQVRSEVLESLFREINNLPPQCKKIFTLIFIKGLNTNEIAQLMGITPRTVLNQKTRALQLLRASFLKRQVLSLALLLCFERLQLESY